MPATSARSDTRRHFQVGEWSVDPGTNELRRGGEAVRIEPKAMDVLVLLAERAGRVVSREELFAAVWPGVVVGDEALTQSIIKLRKALGDRARLPTYIETISKRGYRLLAPVRDGACGPAPPPSADVAFPPTGPAKRPRYAPWAGLLAGVVLAMVVAGVHYVDSRSTAPAAADAPELEQAGQLGWVTVTVLPFEPLGPDRDQAYLARGISENLATDLARLAGLRLIRHSDAATARPPAPGARYLVSGSVQRDSDTLRINVHLTDTGTREQLWSGRFERPFGDLFAVQDEINARLVELLPAKVSDVERRRLARRHTRSLEAYDHFLRGQALFLVRRAEANDGARVFYRKAIETDPNFARAYASLAMTYAMEYRFRTSGDAALALDRAFELANTAQVIDPDIPQVHWALAFVHAQSRRHEQAIESLRRAIELDRSFADAYALLGGIYTYIGQPARSIPLLRTALRLNPDGGYLYFLLLGRAYLFEGDVEQALINLRAALLRNPVDLEVRVYFAAAMMAAGDRDAARWEADEILALEPGYSVLHWLDAYPMTDARQKERLMTLLAEVRP